MTNAPGRPPAFDRDAYRQRNTVERCVRGLEQCRGPATRHHETAAVCLAGPRLAVVSARPAG